MGTMTPMTTSHHRPIRMSGVGVVELLLAKPSHAVAQDRNREEEAREHQAHAPDPVLVLEHLQREGRGYPEEEGDDPHVADRFRPLDAPVHEHAGGQLHHGDQASHGRQHERGEEDHQDHAPEGQRPHELGDPDERHALVARAEDRLLQELRRDRRSSLDRLGQGREPRQGLRVGGHVRDQPRDDRKDRAQDRDAGQQRDHVVGDGKKEGVERRILAVPEVGRVAQREPPARSRVPGVLGQGLDPEPGVAELVPVDAEEVVEPGGAPRATSSHEGPAAGSARSGSASALWPCVRWRRSRGSPRGCRGRWPHRASRPATTSSCTRTRTPPAARPAARQEPLPADSGTSSPPPPSSRRGWRSPRRPRTPPSRPSVAP